MEVPLVRTIARSLAGVGILALRFNFRGVGASEGSFDNGCGEVDDVAGALKWLAVQPKADPERLALVGYSFGAVMAIFQAARASSVRAVALIGLPLGGDLPVPMADPRTWLLVAGERDQFSPWLDLQKYGRQLVGDVMVRSIGDADHFLFGHETEVADMLADFLREKL